DENASEADLDRASARVLDPIATAIAGRLPGEETLVPAAAALPKDNMVPLGIRYVTKDVLGVDGLGAGALGYYKQGDKRWRLAAVSRVDVDQAKDALTALTKVPGAAKEKGIADGAVRVVRRDRPGAPDVEWLFARSGAKVLGIGDEALVPRAAL